MTNTLPWRRMILHLSHIFLTEGRTFIVLTFPVVRTYLYLLAQPLALFPRLFRARVRPGWLPTRSCGMRIGPHIAWSQAYL